MIKNPGQTGLSQKGEIMAHITKRLLNWFLSQLVTRNFKGCNEDPVIICM